MIMFGSFSPEPFGWLAPPSLLGPREPTLSWNHLHSEPTRNPQSLNWLPEFLQTPTVHRFEVTCVLNRHRLVNSASPSSLNQSSSLLKSFPSRYPHPPMEDLWLGLLLAPSLRLG